MAHITDNLFTLMTIGSVEAKSGSIIVCPKKCRREILDVSSLSRNFNGCYANSNMILAFIIENRVFVCPKTKQKIETLVEAGLKKADFYVPYSENEEYPLENEEKWVFLLEEQKRVLEAEFIGECEAFCDTNNIRKLSDEILEKCLEIPKDGIAISIDTARNEHNPHVVGFRGVLANDPERKKMKTHKTVYYPEIKITGEHFNNRVARKLGTYCTNNGKVVFVYRNGKTYVSKFYDVVKALQEAGYIKVPMLVPLSHGEVITDPDLKAKWDSLTFTLL